MKAGPKEIAKMIDHAVLHPTQSDEALKKECLLAAKYRVASICVKPYHVKMAAKHLNNSEVKVSTVIGFPHGGNCIETKVFESQKAIDDGALELDMVINIGKVLQGDWDYIRDEIRAVQKLGGGEVILKVIFETDYVKNPKDIVHLCHICDEEKVDFVKTSTGFGFVKREDGSYSYEGARRTDVEMMVNRTNDKTNVKASGGIRTLKDLLEFRTIGATRIGTSATEAIMNEAMITD